MGQLWNALNKYVTDWAAPLITIHGGHVGGIFYTSKLMDEDMIDNDLRQFTLTNGEPAFQIKRDSKRICSTYRAIRPLSSHVRLSTRSVGMCITMGWPSGYVIFVMLPSGASL